MATVSIDRISNEVWKPKPGYVPPESGFSPTFSVVVPTLARETLPRTLASIAAQIQPGDEIIVECSNENDGGNSARQRGVEAATSSHLAFCDDDDIFLPGAFDIMRQFATEHPTALGVFRRRFNAGPPQWLDPVLRASNVQVMGFVVPNVRGKLSYWRLKSMDPVKQAALEAAGVKRWSQADFISESAELQDATVMFCDVIVGHARPERNPVRKLRYRMALGSRARSVVKGREQHAPAMEGEMPPPTPS